ncbi:reverse transcriptase family protein [Pseudomonas aeruginosa]|uniref:reverse transcriptase family protein n=1 Tax=Pseudomonas aeruginosa TaxID=287 RepID=UPI0009A42956|nr:reverse transcriptase family protein [Pseudomonas aeruginosa]ELT8140762.1 RNA-directed DNA polymerase [Pseudomonas aeruginosa]EMD6027177.1 RNA-directed DNA polymerase [Pseudomonas aeruginosa]MBG4615500.1 RNA-directed DNA polymerase [Pseudomonas aeruginosa]MBG5655541.1 RNA-directed DNA polymerase [Pseudomonas aeruginosa]MBG7078440.1 RNA-directed DNA polymerase [Pseudomonas aeruginosa]
MTTRRLKDIHSAHELAQAVGVSESKILDYAVSDCQEGFYEKLEIPKRGRNRKGEFREVYKANHKWVTQLHRSVSMLVANSASFGTHVQGFLKGRSTLTNAELHLRKSLILHADIRNFFNVITEPQVAKAFLTIGATPEISKLLARISTIDGFLRQGTRCSPIISNLVCKGLDQAMLDLASTHDCMYSRYADNMTISGAEIPDISAISTIVTNNGFELRGSGCYIQRRGSRQFVTGLSVVDRERPRLPKKLKSRLRLAVYYASKYGKEHFERSRHVDTVTPSWAQMKGMIAYAHSIEPDFAEKLWKLLRHSR